MFLKSVFKLSSATLFSQVLVVLVLPILVLLYEPSAFAIYALYIAIVNLVSSAACLRLEHAIVIAKKYHFKYLYSLSFYCAFIAAICSPIFVIIAFQLNDLVYANAVLFLTVSPLGVFFTAAWNINYSCRNRSENYGLIAKAQIAKNIALVAAQLLLGYLFQSNLEMMVIAHVFSLFIANILLRPNIHFSYSLKKFRVILKRYEKFPKYSAPSIFVNTFGKSSIPFFIGSAGGATILGYYALLERLLGGPSALIGNAIGRVYYRSAAKVKSSNEMALRLFDKTSLLLLTLSITFFGSAYLLTLFDLSFVLDEKWQGVVHLLPLLLPIFFLKFIVVPTSMTTNVYEKQKLSLIWNTSYVVSLNVVMGLITLVNDYKLLLQGYVMCSLIFYFILFFLLRGFIKKEKRIVFDRK